MPKPSRKEEYAEITKNALVEAASELFIKQGYNQTSIEDIVRKARVTRGALYHHFSSKEDVFTAVYTEHIQRMLEFIMVKIAKPTDPWRQAIAGCNAFLDYCLDPNNQMIDQQDAIKALGWEAWRSIDAGYTLGMIRTMLGNMMKAGIMLKFPIPTLANLIYGMLVEAQFMIETSSNKKRVRREAGKMIESMLSGLKT